MNAGYHHRRPGEYIRPASRLVLTDDFPNSDDYYPCYARGVIFHRDVFADRRPGDQVELELVAELYNRFDSHAVAIDSRGERVGYLPAGGAALWHDTILAANRLGLSVWTFGQLDPVHLEESAPHLAPTVYLPRAELLNQLIDQVGLGARIRALLDIAGEPTRTELLDQCWESYPSALVRHVATHATQFPELTWPTAPPEGVEKKQDLPGVLYTYLKGMVLAERRAATERRMTEREQARRERDETREREKQERARLKAEALQQRRDDLAYGIEQGWTNRQIAEALSISIATVEKTKRELGGGQASDYNAEVRSERLQRARRAMALQRDGMTRRDIGAELHVGEETVAALLRDAKFYDDPMSDAARLHRAQQALDAVQAGLTRAEFQTAAGLTKPKAAEAWKDADVLPIVTSR